MPDNPLPAVRHNRKRRCAAALAADLSTLQYGARIRRRARGRGYSPATCRAIVMRAPSLDRAASRQPHILADAVPLPKLAGWY